MSAAKRKAVVYGDSAHLDAAERLVSNGRYRSVSEFVREAMSEKLERIAADRVAEQVAQYCATEVDPDDDLIAAQAFDPPARRSKKPGP